MSLDYKKLGLEGYELKKDYRVIGKPGLFGCGGGFPVTEKQWEFNEKNSIDAKEVENIETKKPVKKRKFGMLPRCFSYRTK